MYRQRSYRKPDFFAVLVVLVTLGFGMTVTIQLIASDVDHVVERQPVKSEVIPG